MVEFCNFARISGQVDEKRPVIGSFFPFIYLLISSRGFLAKIGKADTARKTGKPGKPGKDDSAGGDGKHGVAGERGRVCIEHLAEVSEAGENGEGVARAIMETVI